MAVDEIWIRTYTEKSKKQYTSPGEPALMKAKTILSVGKVMATVFWDSQGVIYIEHPEQYKRTVHLIFASKLEKVNRLKKQKF